MKTGNYFWSVLSGSGQARLSDALRLCAPVTSQQDGAALKAWLADTWGNLAMVDYPYPTSFLEPLPAWPVKVLTFVSDLVSVVALTSKPVLALTMMCLGLHQAPSLPCLKSRSRWRSDELCTPHTASMLMPRITWVKC